MNSGRKNHQKSRPMDTDNPWPGVKRPEQRIELRRGQLKNGNPPCDYMKAPRCGAKNRQEKPCQAPALRGRKRCRLHGGKSTGAKTAAGIQRIRAVHWKDGSRSERLIAEGRVLAAKRQREIFNEITKNYDAVTIYTHLLLGLPVFPRVKVRAQLRYPDGPPPEWAKEPDETK
jgi:hypothetical protein